MSKEQHIHKYQRMKIGKKEHVIYRCMLDGCSHFLPNEQLIINRQSLCWECSEPVTYSQKMFHEKIKRPVCADCSTARIERKEALRTL